MVNTGGGGRVCFFILKTLNFLQNKEILRAYFGGKTSSFDRTFLPAWSQLLKQVVLRRESCSLPNTQLPKSPVTTSAASAPSDTARGLSGRGEGARGNRLTQAASCCAYSIRWGADTKGDRSSLLSKAEHQIYQQHSSHPRSLVDLVKLFRHTTAGSVPSEMGNVLLHVICQSRKQL